MRDVVLDGTRRVRELPRDRRVAESPAHKFGDLEFAGRQHVRLPPAVDRPKLRRGLREGELLPGFPGGREAVRSEQQLRGRLYLSEVGKRYLVEPPPGPLPPHGRGGRPYRRRRIPRHSQRRESGERDTAVRNVAHSGEGVHPFEKPCPPTTVRPRFDSARPR